MIGPWFSYLQGARSPNTPLLPWEVQSCQVGSPGSVSGLGNTQLCVPHPSPSHTWATPAQPAPAGMGAGEEITSSPGWELSCWNGGLVKWCDKAERQRWRAERPLVLPWQNWPVNLGSPSVFKLPKASADFDPHLGIQKHSEKELQNKVAVLFFFK